jgi:hypothetical protein
MGLELVELMMDVEDRFQVSLPEEELQGIATVGQLCDLLVRHVCITGEGPCLSSMAFYRVRKALGEVCGTPRNDVRPDSKLEQVVPREGRGERWAELGEALGCDLRPVRPAPRPGLLGRMGLNVDRSDLRIPPGWATVRDMVYSVVAAGTDMQSPHQGSWREEEVWVTARDAVSAVTGRWLPPERITRETRFNEDLGFG